MDSIDWNLCIICGEGGSELRCPADSLQKNGIEIYGEFLEPVEQFRQLEALPVEVTFEGEDVSELFLQKRAKWHKACHLKFSQSKLRRVLEQQNRKRKPSPSTMVDTTERKSKRLALSTPDDKGCIFCSQLSGALHLCSTMRLDHELRKMAEELKDSSLMATIAGGDLVAIDAKYHYNCLSAYKSRYRSLVRSKASNNDSSNDKPLLARAFAELVSYIESNVENGMYIF